MDKIFLDRIISKGSQLRIVIGLLCMSVLYTLLQNIDSFSFSNVSTIQRVCYILADTVVFFYLFKFIRYDLGTKMSFVFIGVIAFINVYHMTSLISMSIFKLDFLENYLINQGLSILKLLAIISLGIRLILNKCDKKKIQHVIQFIGVFLLLQLIAPIVFFNFFFDMFEFELVFKWMCVFFDLMPYITMIYLYVSVLDQSLVVEEKI